MSTEGSSLAEIQREFFTAIRNPLNGEQRSSKMLLDGRTFEEVANKVGKANDRLSTVERLEIYNRQYWFRLIDCLYDDYPGVRALLGEECFYDLVVAYLLAHPSHSYSLRNLGRSFEAFLLQNPHFSGRRQTIAVQMARFEWAQIEAFDGPKLAVFNPALLAGQEPQDLRLALQPYVSLLECDYPVDDFVMALRRDQVQRSEASAELAARADDAPVAMPKRKLIHLVVHRFDNALYYKRLSSAQAALLRSLQAGQTLGEACTIALPLMPERILQKAGVYIQEWFQTWSLLEWFVDPAASEPAV